VDSEIVLVHAGHQCINQNLVNLRGVRFNIQDGEFLIWRCDFRFTLSSTSNPGLVFTLSGLILECP